MQLPHQHHHEESHTHIAALLEAWLGSSLPDSCRSALATPESDSISSSSDAATAAATEHPKETTLQLPPQGAIDAAGRISRARRLQQNLGPANTTGSAEPAAGDEQMALAAANMTAGAEVVNSSTSAAPAASPAAADNTQALPAGQQQQQQADEKRVTKTDAGAASKKPVNAVEPPSPPLPDAANATNSSSAETNTTAATLEPSVLCALAPETGPCRAAIPRWAFVVATGGCTEFTYGGCAGNSNNFQTQETCESACAGVMLGDDGSKVVPVDAPMIQPAGPVATTMDTPRVLAGSSSSNPPPTSSKATSRDWSVAERLLRVLLAGVVGALTVLLL